MSSETFPDTLTEPTIQMVIIHFDQCFIDLWRTQIAEWGECVELVLCRASDEWVDMHECSETGESSTNDDPGEREVLEATVLWLAEMPSDAERSAALQWLESGGGELWIGPMTPKEVRVRLGRIRRGLREIQHLRRIACRDFLTGLPTRYVFELFAHQQIAAAERFGRTDTLLLFDIDSLKQINDQHGHATGDVVLRGVAERLRGAFRKSDKTARWGGDEFVVYLPGIDCHAAAAPTAWLRQMFAADSIELSIGMAEIRPFHQSSADSDSRNAGFPDTIAGILAAALAEADADMYREKHRKRDGN